MGKANVIIINILIGMMFAMAIFFAIILEKEIIERIFIITPFLILWVTFIREKIIEKRTLRQKEIEKQKDIQYFFRNFIEWIVGGKERSSYLENFVLRKFNKYEKYFGISILSLDKLAPDERELYKFRHSEDNYYLIYKIFVLEGKYILKYSIEHFTPLDMNVNINFIKPSTYNKDYKKLAILRSKFYPGIIFFSVPG